MVRNEFHDIYTASSFTQLSAARKPRDTEDRWYRIPEQELKALMKNDKDIKDILNFISNPVTKSKYKSPQ